MPAIRTGIAAAAGLLVAGAVVAVAPGAANAGPAGTTSGAHGFHRVPARSVSGDHIAGLSDRSVQVMVQVDGDPLTVAQANAAAPLSQAQQDQIRQSIKDRQAPVAADVKALGGKIQKSYQAAYNGLRVTVAQSKLAALRAIPGVASVQQFTPKSVDLVHGVPLIGAPTVWNGVAGYGPDAGQGMKVAVIDTGIDYTHADFGGPGTVAAYQAALATDTAPADPSEFGPGAPRVKGGYDFVGDSYNADPTSTSYQPVPHPDTNPLDCAGHGTHTAGDAAGGGVLSNGSSYSGPYNATTVSSHNWNVGPGAAPRADIYSLRVFGCQGSTDVVVDAIEWAVNHHMDVINMSLGSPYGSATDPDAVAVDNATAAGVIVVASAGNEGHNPYMVGSPSTANSAISVAASDPTPSFPGANIALQGGVNLTAVDANGVSVNGITAPVKVLYTGTPHDAAHISLGCDPNEYTAAGVTGDIVVVKRGTCARVARAIYGQKAGAAAVVMVNSSNSLPPFEGPITSNPDNGEPYDVTIPFLGVKSSDGAALVAADGTSATLTDQALANPSYLGLASFTSGGGRTGDSALKPDLTAPGVSIASAGMGTGNQLSVLSGTSMAAPHVAGAAALVREAHPTWNQVKFWKAALVNTADPSMVSDYQTRLAGSGFVQVQRAIATGVVALGDKNTATLSYGFVETGANYSAVHRITLKNFNAKPVTFTVGHSRDSGSPHSLVLPASIKVPAHGTATISVTLKAPVATMGDSSAFHDIAGLITFTPVGGANNAISLSVPYYMVPLATSMVHTTLNMQTLKNKGAATATVANPGSPIAGAADFYAWGISNPSKAGLGSIDIKAVGVQTFPSDGVLAFGLNTYNRWSNAAQNEFDISVDVNGDGTADYLVVEADHGLVTAGDADGQAAVFVFDLRTGDGDLQFLADAPFNGTTMVLPVLFDQLCHEGSPCLSQTNPRITYSVKSFAPDGTTDGPTAAARFNAFAPAVSTGAFAVVDPGTHVGVPVTFNKAEQVQSPALGVMIITHDNRSTNEAQLLKF